MIKKWIESIVIETIKQRGIDLTEPGKILLTVDVWRPVIQTDDDESGVS